MLYGVYNIRNHQVCMPVDPRAPRNDVNVRLAQAPSNPREFHSLAVQMAELLKQSTSTDATPRNGPSTTGILAGIDETASSEE